MEGNDLIRVPFLTYYPTVILACCTRCANDNCFAILDDELLWEMSITAETIDDNYIRLRIEKWSGLPQSPRSAVSIRCCDFPWRILVSKSSENGLEIVVCNLKHNDSNLWFCDVTVEFSLINQNEGGESHSIETRRHRFSPKNNHEGPLIVLKKPNLLENPELGFVKNDTVLLDAKITIHSVAGKRFRRKVEYDFFNPSNKSDGILVVEGKKVYVSKQFLAIQSAFFDTLFFGKFKETTELETEIEEVVLSEFVVLMKMLYRTGEQFSERNVEFVLKLADRFEMLNVLDDAEKYLLGSGGPEIHTKLRLADQYNLFVLQDSLISKYTAELIRELNVSIDFPMLKEETKDLLFRKYIAFTTPK